MRIARFLIAGRPVVAVDGGSGFVDYGAILDARGYGSDMRGADPERRLVRLLRHGLLCEEFVGEQLEWVLHSGRDFGLETEGLTPLLPHRPTKIICVARNYREHAREGGGDILERPIFFAKTDNCALGPGLPIRVPTDVGRVDHEGELGVVISRRAAGVKADEAMRCVLGYTVINDVTARELQKRLAERGLPWFHAKSRDTFAPLGPAIVSTGEVGDLSGKRIRVWVNGDIRQDGLLDDMVWKPPQLIAEISAVVTLLPGDVIATGTPSGVGGIAPGDEVVVAIDGVGRLANPVEASSASDHQRGRVIANEVKRSPA